MSKRLTQAEAEVLRSRILDKMAKYPNDFQSASEWRDSGFESYTTAQMKRQLEVLVRAGKVKANRHPGAVYYGAADE